MAGKPGRRERPLDPKAGPLERFALALRELRERAGLTYTEMADAAHFSASTLSQAAAGHRLPTIPVLLAYVRACGEPPGPWVKRWERLEHEAAASEPAQSPTPITQHESCWDEATSFVGRERELESASALLERRRLVTLAGVGGVGKTRLARRVVRQVARRFPDGIYWVELADIRSDEAVAAAVAAVVGVQASADRDPLGELAKALQGRSVLVLLDNCEHVLEASARISRGLLAHLPKLRILTTSRQPLDTGEEQVLQIEPLDLPPTGCGCTDEAGTTAAGEAYETSSAVSLFLDRAAAASPGLRVTDADRHTITQVCRKLDGLPLALEIAARRLRMLTIEELLERLDQRFRVLGPGGRDRTAHPRHQALRALFDWSYELCTDAEREAWQQLSLCTGGVLLTDAEQLCAQTTTSKTTTAAPIDHPFESLAGLVDKSLLTRVDIGGRTRLHMLETVRSYGQERLAESDETHRRALRRHRAWYLGLSAQAGAAYGSSEQAKWLRRLRPEHANLRQIITAPPPDEEPPETVLRASLGLWLHCLTSGNVGEGAHWMRMITSRYPRPPRPETTLTWCRAVWVAGFLLFIHGDHNSTTQNIERGEKFLAQLSATPSHGNTETSAVARAELSAAFLQLRGLVALVNQDIENSTRHAQASLDMGRSSEMLLTQQQCIAQLAFTAVIAGDHARATPLLEKALAISEAQGDTWHRCYLLWIIAIGHGEAGRPKEALSLLRSALRHTWEIEERMGEAALSETLAWVLASNGDAYSAALVLGAVDRVWRPSGAPRLFGFVPMTAHRKRGLERARHALGDTEYAQAFQDGQHLGLRTALREAFESAERLIDRGP